MAERLYKTTIVVYSDYDPQEIEIADLVRDATHGESYCAGTEVEVINKPELGKIEGVGEGFFDFFNVKDPVETAGEASRFLSTVESMSTDQLDDWYEQKVGYRLSVDDPSVLGKPEHGYQVAEMMCLHEHGEGAVYRALLEIIAKRKQESATQGIEQRIEQVVEAAQDAFWAEMQKHFPTAKTGDFSVDAACVFDEACKTAIRRWLSSNLRVSFPFKGMEITNPFESECGRFKVDPRYYGFEEWHTGGIRMALRKELNSGDYILLTDENGPGFPDLDAARALIGLYDEDGNDVVYHPISIPVGPVTAPNQ